ncbi:MAG: hypothetical protein JSV49_11190 [Thermoplasmata archaeon]|nr:MAG: hypothetical protein JSV49_11190 [Thermoplasmata archaeon]
MTDCMYCGAPLAGAKRFCVKCGREQKDTGKSKEKKKEPKKSKKEDEKKLECHKCGGETERICYFCGKPICQGHTYKMQANALPALEFKTAASMGHHRRINAGWRGFIISTCPRCMSMNDGRALDDNELVEIQTVDKCTWFKLSPKSI